MKTISVNKQHLEEALNALTEAQPESPEHFERQVAAIEGIIQAIDREEEKSKAAEFFSNPTDIWETWDSVKERLNK
jgi:hypothetical protein